MSQKDIHKANIHVGNWQNESIKDPLNGCPGKGGFSWVHLSVLTWKFTAHVFILIIVNNLGRPLVGLVFRPVDKVDTGPTAKAGAPESATNFLFAGLAQPHIKESKEKSMGWRLSSDSITGQLCT